MAGRIENETGGSMFGLTASLFAYGKKVQNTNGSICKNMHKLNDDYKDILSAINDIHSYVWHIVKNSEGILFFENVSTNFAKACQKHVEDFYHLPVKGYLAQEDYSRLLQGINTASRHGRSTVSINFPLPDVKKSGVCSLVHFPASDKCLHITATVSDVNPISKIALKLNEEKEKVNQYIELAGVMMLVMDIKGKIKYVNRKVTEVLGYEHDYFEGKDWFTTFLPDSISREVKSRFFKLMNGKQPEKSYENPVICRDGTQKYIFWHSSVMKDKSGKITGLVCSGEDVTNNKKMQDALHLHSFNADFMYSLSRIISESGKIEDFLYETTALLASHPNILGGKIKVFDDQKIFSTSELNFGTLPGALTDKIDELLEKLNFRKLHMSGSQSHDLVYLYYGVKHRSSIIVCPMHVRDEFQGILILASVDGSGQHGTFSDHIANEIARGIKKKKIEHDHRESEVLFSTMFHTIPDAVSVATLNDGIFLEVNKVFEEMTGYRRDEILGESSVLSELWCDSSDRRKIIELLRSETKVSGYSAMLRKKDGSTFAGLISATTINYKGSKCLMTVVKDITQRMKIEREILSTKQLLEKITYTTPSFISLYDVKSDKILYQNKSLLDSLGYGKEKIKEAGDMGVVDRRCYYHPEDVQKIIDFDEKINGLKKGDIIKLEYRIRDSKGRWIWFQHSVSVYQEETEYQPLLTINLFEYINDRKAAEESLSRHSKEIELLYQAGKDFSSTLDLAELYDRMYTIISNIADLKELIVTNYDEENKMILYKYLRSKLTEDRIDVSSIPPIPLAPPGFGIVSAVIRSGNSMILDQYSEHFKKVKTTHVIDQFGNLVEDKNSASESPRSAMIIPIKYENKILGVVQIYSDIENAYTNEQLKFVESLMHDLALANRNVMLYEKAQQEITDRTHAEENLKRSEQNLRQFAESVPDVIYRINYNTLLYEFLSPSIEKMLGFTQKEVENDPVKFIRTVMHPDDIDIVSEQVGAHVKIQCKEPLHVECRMIRKDSRVIWVRDSIKFEYDNGKVIAAVGAMSDITERVLEEQKRRMRDEQIIIYQSALLDLSKLSGLDLQAAFRNITEVCSRALQTCRTSIWLFDPEFRKLICKDEYSAKTSEHNGGMVMEGPEYADFFTLMRSDRKMYTANAEKDEILGTICANVLIPNNTSSSLISRIWFKGNVVGLLCIESSSPEQIEWNPEQYDFAVSVTGFISLSIESDERLRAEEEIKRSLKDKELLLREIHHRVKNNLQVISSLLYLQSKKSGESGVNEALLESQRRVKSMVLIHEKLYRSEDLASINYSEYISELTNTLFRSYRLDTSQIKLELDIGNFRLNTDTAVQCGLIINELVSNAIKHAFRNGNNGTIFISFHSDDQGVYTLKVRDDGEGVKDPSVLETSDTLGMQLIRTLVDQMDGTIEIFTEKGVGFVIRFQIIK